MKESILHKLAAPMGLQDHVWASLTDTPRKPECIAAEVSQYLGRTVSTRQVMSPLERGVRLGVVERTGRGWYRELQDHFSESRFRPFGEVA